MRIVSVAGAMLLGCLLWAHSAAASTITKTIAFTATDFVSSSGNVAAPVPTVSGSFSMTFDPTLSYSTESTDILLNNININVSGTPIFTTQSIGPFFYGVTIGMGPDTSVAWGTNDFFLLFNLQDTVSPFSALFGYSQAGINNFFSTNNVALTITPSVATTPIPGSVLLLLTGLGAMGGVGFLRKRNAAAGAELVSA